MEKVIGVADGTKCEMCSQDTNDFLMPTRNAVAAVWGNTAKRHIALCWDHMMGGGDDARAWMRANPDKAQ